MNNGCLLFLTKVNIPHLFTYEYCNIGFPEQKSSTVSLSSPSTSNREGQTTGIQCYKINKYYIYMLTYKNL